MGKNPFDTSPISRSSNKLAKKKENINLFFIDRTIKIPSIFQSNLVSSFLPSLPFLHPIALSPFFFSFLSYFSQDRNGDVVTDIYSWTDTSCQGCINNNAPHPCIGIVAPIAQHSNCYDSYQSIERSNRARGALEF